MATDPIRICIGADERQWLATRVLEFSIREHASGAVDIRSLGDLAAGRESSKTGFSFARFAIPEIYGSEGRALYLDADMLVFRDIRALWELPMDDGVGLLYSRQPKGRASSAQFAVLVMDCSALKFDVQAMIEDLEDGRVGYHELLYQFGMLPETIKAPGVPLEWNSLEHYVSGETALIHFTLMPFQPWVYPHNPNGKLWYSALQRAVVAGFIEPQRIAAEIDRGHVAPALPRWAGIEVPGERRRGQGWIAPALRAAPPAALHARFLDLVRRHVLLAPWFQGLRGRLDPRRYTVYGHPNCDR